MSDDIKERNCAVDDCKKRLLLARIEALEAERSCTCCDIPCPLEALARIEALEAQLAVAREALEKIACNHVTEQPLWWQLEARRALASLPAPEAAPTREEPTAEAIREILRAHIFASRHYEIRGLDEAANAILALKAAPAK